MNLATLALAVLAAAAPADSVVMRLPETVITGTRLTYPALRAPVAYSVVDRTQFASGRQISLAEALSGVPGLFAQSRGGGQDVRITIRGFGARGNGERSNSGNMRGIRVITDGIPISDPDGRTSLDLVDLGAVNHIEVSRSNASALYGNASGGVIHLFSDLDFASSFVRYEQRAGGFGFHREQGVLGFAAGPTRGTFSLSSTAFAGWRQHSQSDATVAQLRLSSPLSDRGRVLLIADGASTLNRFPGALTSTELAADPRQADPDFVSRDERRFNRIARVAAVVDQTLTERQSLTLSLWAEPRKLQRSERNRFRDFNRYHLGGNGTWSARWQAGDALEARTSAGFDESLLDGSILFYDQVNGARGTTLVANKREGANSAGGFVQQELTWNRRWSAQAALRYDNLWYIAEDFITPSLDARKRFTRLTPKGSLSYRAERHTLYAAMGGGVEAPAFNEIDPPPQFAGTSFNPLLDAMHSRTWEVGARGEWEAMGAWRYDVAGYWIDVNKDIVSQGGGAYFYTAGQTRRRGLEAALQWQAAARLALRGTGTYSQNRYRVYRNDAGDFAGNDIPGLPAAVFSGGAALTLPAGLRLDTSVEGASRYFADDANQWETFSYGLWNASLTWAHDGASGRLSAFVAGQNLLDKEHVASVFINGIDNRFYEPGLPRQVSAGLTLTYR